MLLVAALGLASVGCPDEETGGGGHCAPTCVCEGLPGRPLNPCSECNANGEVFLRQERGDCTARLASQAANPEVCEYRLESDDPTALALQFTLIELLPDREAVVPIPTVSNGPSAGWISQRVIITATSVDDPSIKFEIPYTVRSTCQ